MITLLALLAAVVLLVSGFIRARPFGKLGVLAWLQSVALMAPWLIFFGLFAAGIYLNLVGVLFLLVASTIVYIVLGRQLRALGQDVTLARRIAAIQDANDTDNGTAEAPDGNTSAQSEQPLQQPVPASAAGIQVPELIPIPAEDLTAIRSIFGVATFFATETIPYQDGVIFRGNLRGDLEQSYDDLSTSLREKLADRYRLFLVENQDGKPVVIVLPSTRDPQLLTTAQKALAVVLMVMTIAACLESGGLMLGFDLFNAPDRIAQVIPLGGGILAVLATHEIGHWLMARRYTIPLNWPFFIPTWQIGSFGAITRFASLLPNRKVLFDIAFAGPAAGGLLSLVMLVTGLVLSHQGSLFQVPTEFFQGSILVGTLSRIVLRESLQDPIVDVNPLVILGWLGLVINALNLLPAGQLDGGRIVQAIYGRKVAVRTTIGTIIVLGLASLVNPLALFWAIVVLFLQRDLERPCLNDLVEADDARAALGLVALFLMITTLLPLTPSLAGRLGIGG